MAVLIAIITEILLSSRTVVDVDFDYAVSCVQTLLASLSVRTSLTNMRQIAIGYYSASLFTRLLVLPEARFRFVGHGVSYQRVRAL